MPVANASAICPLLSEGRGEDSRNEVATQELRKLILARRYLVITEQALAVRVEDEPGGSHA